MRLLAAALLFVAVPAMAQAPAADPGMARRIRADVEFLASDNLEGRDTGSRGHAIAAHASALNLSVTRILPTSAPGGGPAACRIEPKALAMRAGLRL